jgi:hypothetical protein
MKYMYVQSVPPATTTTPGSGGDLGHDNEKYAMNLKKWYLRIVISIAKLNIKL